MIFPFWMVLVAALLPILAIVPAKVEKGYDNADPRGSYEALSPLARRAVAAERNGWEAFVLFAVAVMVAYLSASPAVWLSGLAFAFVALRIAYVACYWAGLALLRSIVWSLGFFVTIAIFLLPVVT